MLYLFLLFPLAKARYDLGYDEAVYIEYAGNFAKTAIVYITLNEEIMFIDTIAMLPHYITSLPNFWFNLTEVWHFKLVASVLSILSLIGVFHIVNIRYDLRISVIFIFLLVLQPGFGFVASSYFGELLQAVLLVWGFHVFFKDTDPPKVTRNLILSALLISLTVHTKFQLSFIITLTLLALFISSGQKNILKLLGFVTLFTLLISIIRTHLILSTKCSGIIMTRNILLLFAREATVRSL